MLTRNSSCVLTCEILLLDQTWVTPSGASFCFARIRRSYWDLPVLPLSLILVRMPMEVTSYLCAEVGPFARACSLNNGIGCLSTPASGRSPMTGAGSHNVQDCGHSMYDAGIKHQLLEATDCMRAVHDGSQCREDNLHTAVI